MRHPAGDFEEPGADEAGAGNSGSQGASKRKGFKKAATGAAPAATRDDQVCDLSAWRDVHVRHGHDKPRNVKQPAQARPA